MVSQLLNHPFLVHDSVFIFCFSVYFYINFFTLILILLEDYNSGVFRLDSLYITTVLSNCIPVQKYMRYKSMEGKRDTGSDTQRDCFCTSPQPTRRTLLHDFPPSSANHTHAHPKDTSKHCLPYFFPLPPSMMHAKALSFFLPTSLLITSWLSLSSPSSPTPHPLPTLR